MIGSKLVNIFGMKNKGKLGMTGGLIYCSDAKMTLIDLSSPRNKIESVLKFILKLYLDISE